MFYVVSTLFSSLTVVITISINLRINVIYNIDKAKQTHEYACCLKKHKFSVTTEKNHRKNETHARHLRPLSF